MYKGDTAKQLTLPSGTQRVFSEEVTLLLVLKEAFVKRDWPRQSINQQTGSFSCPRTCESYWEQT